MAYKFNDTQKELLMGLLVCLEGFLDGQRTLKAFDFYMEHPEIKALLKRIERLN